MNKKRIVVNYMPFDKRLGINQKKMISSDFPITARVGLYYIILDLLDKNYIQTEYHDHNRFKYINLELARMCRSTEVVADNDIHHLLYTTTWVNVFNFIERVYLKLLSEVNSYDINGEIEGPIKSLSEVQEYYVNEINTLLNEEGLAYEFDKGLFNRKGFPKTVQSIENATKVLSDPQLNKSRYHFLKALNFFNNIKDPDYENSIKEAICAVEACLIALYSSDISKNFENCIRTIIGNESNKVPAPLIDSLIKLYGYRNNGIGVSHATNKGLKVSIKEAEFMISVCADYITYFYSLLTKKEEEIPF